ncbi:MAG: PIN/TRAM domain-containing protein [Phycisphaerales bacterium]
MPDVPTNGDLPGDAPIDPASTASSAAPDPALEAGLADALPLASTDLPGTRLAMTPSQRMELEARRRRLIMLLLRVGYLTVLVVAVLLPFVAEDSRESADVNFVDYLGYFFGTFAFGAVVLLIDALLPNKRLGTVFAIYFGLVVGMVAALTLGLLVDLVVKSWDLESTFKGPILVLKLGLGITLCYLAVSIVLTTRDDLRLVIPYVEFKREVRGQRPVLLDTSVLIDGRIEAIGQTGFLDAPLIVPQFVIDELQTLADLADRTRRARGRRGLDMLKRLQTGTTLDVTVDGGPESAGASGGVDSRLLQLARRENYRVMTTDANLARVAQIHGVVAMNINDLAGHLKPQVIAGDELTVELQKAGEGDDQAVGYMPDGTMVVVEDARHAIGRSVGVVVTNSLRTSAGRMIFARLDAHATPPEVQRADAATSQPRTTGRPDRRGGRSDGRRNPRRG